MFEKLKQTMLERIEKDSIKVNVNGEKVYLKKSGFPKEWHVIYPPVDPETGKWDKLNFLFGGKANALKYLVIGVIVLLLTLGVYEVVSSYNTIMSNPSVQICLQQAGISLG